MKKICIKKEKDLRKCTDNLERLETEISGKSLQVANNPA
jgi:hypothetical protein